MTLHEAFKKYEISHFTPEELTVSARGDSMGYSNTPRDLVHLSNLFYLAFFLNFVRNIVGIPILINSAYRSEVVNKLVGGVPNSKHRLGLAVDIQHIRNYEQYLQIFGRNARWIHDYTNRGFFHVDFTREFLITFFKTHKSLVNETENFISSF